jgi:hypothetical protein
MGLIIRVRELIWIAIGVALMKVGNNATPTQNHNEPPHSL